MSTPARGDFKLGAMTPSEEMISKSNPSIEVQDSLGRTLVIKRPPFTAQWDLVELLGASADSERYLGMCLPLLYLQSINGSPAMFNSKETMKKIIQLLGEEGFSALASGIRDNFPSADIDKDKLQKKSETDS